MTTARPQGRTAARQRKPIPKACPRCGNTKLVLLNSTGPRAVRYPPLPHRVYVAVVVRELWWLAVAVSAAGAAVALVAWGGAW